MELIESKTESYCKEYCDIEPEALKIIDRSTQLNQLKPRMLSGHFQGRVLALLSSLVNPKRILEIGTFTGYSAICLAEGLADKGKLITIEANEELESVILNNIKLAGISDKIELIIGNALEVIPKLDEKFDLVFIDADKLNYKNYYDLVIDKVNLGGLIISDNVLWDGKVMDETKNDSTTIAIRQFNDHLKNDNRTQKVLFPIRDGLFVSRKIK
ncbi:MAG: O-methyltransferase [Cytophagaceae bacterium]|nr:O-methyltransferase [Cytophagaceae bacterium]